MKWWQDDEEHLHLLQQDLHPDQDRDEDQLQADPLQHDEEEDKIFFFSLFSVLFSLVLFY